MAGLPGAAMIRMFSFVAVLMLAAAPGIAQPRPPSAADPRQEAARIAFEALPEAERKAIQDALVWTGDYNGVLDGSFGKRSYDAIVAFEARMKLDADGILQGTERAALLAAGDKGRQAVRFAAVNDTRAGIRIGIPARLLAKVAPIPAGTSYRAEDGGVFLETRAYPQGAALAELYAGLVADLPGRKITYKVLRADWFVVTGDEGDRTFYTRAAATPDGVRGYTLNYRKARKDLLSLAVAIANSFEPAVQAAAPIPAAGSMPAPAAVADASTARPAGLTALAVAPGRFVTDAAALKSCAAPRIAGAPVRVTRSEGALALLEGSGGRASGLAAAPARTGPSAGPADVLVLAMGRSGGVPALTVTPGAVLAAEGRAVLRAALDHPAGAIVVDREGRLVGLARQGAPLRRIGDTALAAAYPLAPGEAVLALAASARPEPAGVARITAGDIAMRLKGAVVAVDCP